MSPGRLRETLSVEFSGEEGIDGGALRVDFFEILMKEIDAHLLEGNPVRRLPKKDWGLESTFVLAGTMVAHSLVQGGPGLPILCPAMYYYLVTLDKDIAMQHFPLASDIPRNLATQDLLELIEKVSRIVDTWSIRSATS